ncbi:hypothetical protein Adt_23475 [Abeliophyllum distichum]|uniref:Uncharacterized protein n=1 Tax=Abeliophyllum distichum TaxID=126358 RepID=A0ABD1SBE8_9LAMI
MTVRQRSHLSENHQARALILVQEQNRLRKELSTTSEKYVVKMEEYKKNINEYYPVIERLEAEVERRMKELEGLRKNPKAKTLRIDVRCLVNDIAAVHTRAKEKEDKLQKEIEKKGGD